MDPRQRTDNAVPPRTGTVDRLGTGWAGWNALPPTFLYLELFPEKIDREISRNLTNRQDIFNECGAENSVNG